jgi:phospholipid-binding lipoprotein MlaA
MRARRTLALVLGLAAVLAASPVAARDPAPDASPVVGDLADDTPDYDPWQPFNERTFWFNYYVLDKRLLKPVAHAWDRILPDPVQHGVDDAFDNLSMPRRLLNHLLQVRPKAAGREIARFMFNSTFGLAGFIDVARRMGVQRTDADAGETLGVWGVGPGPYLVVPFLPPLTFRDGVGYGVDSVTDPLGYGVSVPFGVSIATTIVRRVNERSLQPAAYENIEETVLDLYSAVRNAYLQRRRVAIRRACEDSLVFRPVP